ncbi:Rhodanese-like domain-containing protein [Cynara cardunculus var. scolymus]|uniref:Rhodanese-like domain-containing protein n=1 Tax=Cynara cardunculus var. scolymus TaxID=59895 RepID=A0A118K3T0_CYNCS|nr:Rhodanese-like domain-containing protein [Cynara cardunculus var. scolymus]
MALRASTTARLRHHQPPPPPPPKTLIPFKPTPRIQPRPDSYLSLSTSTTLSLLTLFTSPIEAHAFTISKDDVVSSLTQVEEKIDLVQKVGYNVFEFTGNAVKTVTDFLKPAAEVAMPVLKQAGGEAIKIASPVISEASKKAQEAFQSSGFDTQPVYDAAKTVADAAEQTGKVAKPIASTTVQTISSADPTTIAVTGGALVLAYFLLPPVFSAISFNFRGYKGDLTPAQVLDLVTSKNYTLIDIRSENDKDKSGVPRLPSSAKNKMIAKLEAEIAALKISYLKRINKGSNIVILDTYTDSAKIVARCLTELGFQNSWIVADGFSGGKGWLQSRLGTDSYNVSFSRVLSPSRVIPAVRSFGTTSSAKLLSD